MNNNVEHVMTRDEAFKLIKSRHGKQIYVGGAVDLPIVDKPGRIFPGYAVISVTRRQALRWVSGALDGLEGRGARIRIQVSDTAINI